MNVLDDKIHQLFSEILVSGDQGQGLVYENQEFPSSSGIKYEEKFILDGSSGLLGLRHPLQIKSNLISALSPFIMASQKETHSFFEDLSFFFKSLLGGIEIGPSSNENKCAFFPGRFNHFLNDSDRILTEVENLNMNNIFSFDFSLGKKNKKNDLFKTKMSKSDYLLNTSILRLLKDGQFYNQMGLVKHKVEKLSEIFSQIEGVTCHGLTVSLNSKIKMSHVISHEELLIFPLYYREEDVHELACALKENICLS